MKRLKSTVQKTLIGILALVGCLLLLAPPALAAPATACNAQTRATYNFALPMPWDHYLPCRPGVGVYIDKLESLVGLLYWAVDGLLKIAGYLAIGFVLYGSIKYIKAQGEPSEINAAKTTISQALIGLVICIASVAIINFVAGGFS